MPVATKEYLHTPPGYEELAASVVDLQKQLTSIIGVSGRERDIGEFILTEITKYTDECWIDPLGNVLAIKKGKEGVDGSLRVLLDAHMDEVGFMITDIEPEGFLHFTAIGTVDPRIYPGSMVLLKTPTGAITGIIGIIPPHMSLEEERTRTIPEEKLFVDIGVSNREEVKKMGIDVGTTGVLHTPFEHVKSLGLLRGRAFDDRTGCNVLLHIARLIAKNDNLPNTILFSFAVCEEVGSRGARTAAYSLNPDIAIAIENTSAADFPGIPPFKCPTAMGNGPAITVADKSIICDERLVELLKKRAEEMGIKWQYKKPIYGGTDAGPISMTKHGIPAAVLSIPCRYIHSQLAQLKISDIVQTISLLHQTITNKIPW